MAKRVTQSDIEAINKAYQECGTYSGAAKLTGWSAGTVKKYIVEGVSVPITKRVQSILSKENLLIDLNWNDWLRLTMKEKAAIEELRKEFSL